MCQVIPHGKVTSPLKWVNRIHVSFRAADNPLIDPPCDASETGIAFVLRSAFTYGGIDSVASVDRYMEPIFSTQNASGPRQEVRHLKGRGFPIRTECVSVK